MQNVRLFFSKTGMAKYISHLDLMRCMTRAIKRAALPVWFTEGYNPHLFMTFALPLSLGVESVCETVDIRITEEISFEEIKEKMNNSLPRDIKVYNVCEPKLKATEIAFAQYEITFTVKNTKAVQKHFDEILSSDEIMAEKKAKQGRRKIFKQINLKEFVKDYSLESDNDTVKLLLTLTAGQTNNINPTLLIDALVNNFDAEILSTDILKLKLFTSELAEFE